VIDLSGIATDEASAIQFVRFEVDAPTSASGRNAFDNILVTGTAIASAVPEPSTYAAIFGCVTLAFVGTRRRRK